MKHLIYIILNIFRNGSERSLKAKKNIFWMLFLRGGSILISFLLVPMTIHYVDQSSYGIWLTLSSIIAWFQLFDIGLSNGLRNRLAEALAHGELNYGKKLVSTTYAMLTIISIPMMIVLLFINPMIDWCSLLNLHDVPNTTLVNSLTVIIIYFCVNFIFSIINTILLADQKPADASLRGFIQQLSTLIIIFFLTKFTTGNLIYLCLGLCASPLLICILFNFTLFNGRYKNISPQFKSIDFSTLPSLMKLGIQFFIIQIAAIIQYQAINFIIIRNFGPNDVTSYNVCYKCFSVIYMVWGILTTPLWTASTDAFAKNDISWVVNAKRKYLKTWIYFVCIGLVLFAVSKWFFSVWVGPEVIIPYELSFWVLIYISSMMFGTIYVSILNGAGILKVQTYASIISPILFIGLSAIFIYMGLDIYSILIAVIASNFNGIVLAPIQYNHHINKIRLKNN